MFDLQGFHHLAHAQFDLAEPHSIRRHHGLGQ
jgi:hypothetical protein